MFRHDNACPIATAGCNGEKFGLGGLLRLSHLLQSAGLGPARDLPQTIDRSCIGPLPAQRDLALVVARKTGAVRDADGIAGPFPNDRMH